MKKNIILLVVFLCITTLAISQNISIKTNPALLVKGNIVLGSDIVLNNKSSLELQLDVAAMDLDLMYEKNSKNIQVRYKRDLFNNAKSLHGFYGAGVVEAGHLKWSSWEGHQTYYAGVFGDVGYQFTWKRFHFDSFVGVGYVTEDAGAFADPDCTFCGLDVVQDMYFIENVPVRLGIRLGYTL